MVRIQEGKFLAALLVLAILHLIAMSGVVLPAPLLGGSDRRVFFSSPPQECGEMFLAFQSPSAAKAEKMFSLGEQVAGAGEHSAHDGEGGYAVHDGLEGGDDDDEDDTEDEKAVDVGVGGVEVEVDRLRKRNERLRKELQHSYGSNYYQHIPKAGGYSAFHYLELDRREISSIAAAARGGKNSSSFSKSGRVCNHGGAQIGAWKKWRRDYPRCWLHATESFYSPEPSRRFVVLREPVSHVLSMWNYCTQSPKRRRKARTMPRTMDDWLHAWEEVLPRELNCPQLTHGGGTERGCPAFKCYNPLNLQTERTRMKGRNPMDLRDRYEVVGILSELEKSTCLVSIVLHGRVPKRCVCSRGTSDGSASQAKAPDKVRIDHGVIRHGDDLTNVTEYQLRAIRNITRDDDALYRTAESIFWEKVRDVEAEYDIALC